MTEVNIDTERVDDVPVLIRQQQAMGIPQVLDEVLVPHGNREGMSMGWLTASWLAYIMIAFTLSCAFAGLIGGYYAHFIGILTPDIMSTLHTVEVTALNIIGGRGSIWGPLLAAFLVIPTFESLKSLMEVRLIIYGLLLMATIVFYPAGLVGILQTVWERIRRRES